MFDFLFLFLGRPSMSMVVNSQLITRALAENEAVRVWNVPLIVSVHPNISQKARGKVFLHASRMDENSCWQQGNVPFFFLVTAVGEILRKSYKRRGPTPSPFMYYF